MLKTKCKYEINVEYYRAHKPPPPPQLGILISGENWN